MAPLPMRTFAGVQVPDTPLITAALTMCRTHLNDMAYNHSVRAWLFGFLIASKCPELSSRDLEAHSIAAILHDIGWDLSAPFSTHDRRFEVDGAEGARDFLRREGVPGEWDAHRLQLVWDAIALHGHRSIAWYKEPEVVAASYGINADFAGPDRAVKGLLSWEEWEMVTRELPRLGMKEGVKEICCEICRRKPGTTYDNFVGQFGEKYLKGEGFTRVGKESVDFMDVELEGV